MSNEQEQVVGIEEALAVGIEEALAEAYAAYVNFAYEQVSKAFHDLDFVEWVHTRIKPLPEWTKWKTDGPAEYTSHLAHLHRLIKNADIKSAEEAAESSAGHILSFKSFVQDVIYSCEYYGRVPQESCFELQ